MELVRSRLLASTVPPNSEPVTADYLAPRRLLRSSDVFLSSEIPLLPDERCWLVVLRSSPLSTVGDFCSSSELD